MTEPGDENLLHFLASTVESIRDRLDGVDSRMGRLETKLEGIENQMDGLETGMGSLETGQSGLQGRLDQLENRMEVGFTSVRGDLERVNLRLDSIERMLSARLDRVETEVSRLRSVLYLLVKDKPELLRLLGETTLS